MVEKKKEAAFQRRLISELRTQGWKVSKIQSVFGYINLDLFATHPDYGPMWLELKTIKSIGTKIPLTDLQRKEMRELQLGGCNAACLVCIKLGTTEHLYLTTNPKEEHLNESHRIQSRPIGGTWDGRRIGDAINPKRTG